MGKAVTNAGGTGNTLVNNKFNDSDDIQALNEQISTKVNPNVIINGCFRVNQRAKSGTVTLAAGEYGHDRWKAGASGCTYTSAASGGVATITITAGSLIQVIEGVNLETGTYALSWTGTVQGKIGAGSAAESPVTGSVTGGVNLSIEFGSGTLSKVKLEKGSVATPFVKRSLAEEFVLCRRYYKNSYSSGTAIGTATPTGSFMSFTASGWFLYNPRVLFDAPMRPIPSVTLYSSQNATTTGVGSEYDAGSTFVADIASSVIEKTDKGFSISAATGTYTVGSFIRFHWVADAEL